MIELLKYLATVLKKEELKIVSYIISQNPEIIDAKTLSYIVTEVENMEKIMKEEKTSMDQLLKDNNIKRNKNEK